ncbi:MAG: electron transport complex subunit RsxC, partial [Oscillospiraceae bacterium]|nr:electron transport complex subunit RsxC [Oscillospiraceae bacterium]
MRKLPVIAIPHYKHTAKSVPMEIPVPAEVRLPMSMHAGTPATPIVKVGEEVQVGQLIGESTGRVSSPIHASVSGTIKAIDTIDGFTGEQATSIVIASDGLQTRYSGQKPPPQVTNLEEFLEAVHNSGVVGLGGAGYPTAPK